MYLQVLLNGLQGTDFIQLFFYLLFIYLIYINKWKFINKFKQQIFYFHFILHFNQSNYYQNSNQVGANTNAFMRKNEPAHPGEYSFEEKARKQRIDKKKYDYWRKYLINIKNIKQAQALNQVYFMHTSEYLSPVRKSKSVASSIKQNQSLDSFLRKKAEEYFFKLANQEITQQQMKVQFSKDILTMFLTSVPANIVEQKHIHQMQQHLQQNMTFLKTLYPEPKTSIINRHLFEGLKQFDSTEKVQFDFLANLDFRYEIKNQDSPRTDILSQTQSLLNSLITSSEKTLNQFTNLLMVEIPDKLTSDSKAKYEALMKQPSKFDLETDVTKTSRYNRDLVSQKLYFPSIDLFKVVYQWTQNLQQIIEEPEKYLTQKTQYLKILNNVNRPRIHKNKHEARIFNHFPSLATTNNQKSLPTGSEIFKSENSNSTTVSEPSFFRRMWSTVTQLCNGSRDLQQQHQLQKIDFKFQPVQESTFKNDLNEPTIQNVERFSNLEFKKSGYMLKNYIESLGELSDEVKYKKFCDEQLEFLRKGYIQTIRVVDKNKIKQKYTIEEKKVYSFCQNTYFFMEEIIIERFIKLIQAFLKLREKSQSQYQKAMVFRDVDLVKFNEKNVISAFIVADDKLINDIFNALNELATKREAKIAKVQNKFGTASNDAIIMIKIKNNPLLCRLRLIQESSRSGPQSKQRALGLMHKFLTQIQQCNYGPISYLSLILATKDFRVTYLKSIRKQVLEGNVKLAQVCHCGKGNVSERSSVNTFEKQVKNIISPDGNILQDCYRNLIPTSFVCGVCEKVVKKGQCVIPIPSCSDCGFHICVECSFQNNPQAQKNIYAMLINSVAKIVDPCYFSQLQVADQNKKNYNHSYTKDVQVLTNGRAEVRKQVHYHIMLEATNFVRFGKYTQTEEFWNNVKQNIDLRSLPEYKDAIKQTKFAGILFKPRQLLRVKGQPFIFLMYDSQNNKFFKLVYKLGEEKAVETPITFDEINISENDAFMPILWIFGESLVTQYITKVLQTNPFCVKKVPIKDASIDRMRFSRSRISSHHIIK